MKQHTWEIEVVDGGPVGWGKFWRCSACGASGGPAEWGKWAETPQMPPFLAGWGTEAGKLSLDCDEAKEQIRRLTVHG